MVTTRDWRRHSASHMIIVHLKTVGFKGSFNFETWIEIQGCGRMRLVVLKVPGEDLEWSSNCMQKVFYWMRHGVFLLGSSIVELIFEFLHMEEHFFGSIVYRYN